MRQDLRCSQRAILTPEKVEKQGINYVRALTWGFCNGVYKLHELVVSFYECFHDKDQYNSHISEFCWRLVT